MSTDPKYPVGGPKKPKVFRAEQLEKYKKTAKEIRTVTLNKHGDLHASRPKGVVAMVKHLTDDGARVLEMWANIALRGEHEGTEFGNRERIEASKLLFERGFGKSVEAHVLFDARSANAAGEVDISSTELTRMLYALAPPPGTPTVIMEGNVRRGDAEFGGEMPDVLMDGPRNMDGDGKPLGPVVEPEPEEAVLVPGADDLDVE